MSTRGFQLNRDGHSRRGGQPSRGGQPTRGGQPSRGGQSNRGGSTSAEVSGGLTGAGVGVEGSEWGCRCCWLSWSSSAESYTKHLTN